MAGSQWYGQISQMMGNTADSTIYGKVDMLKKIWNVYAGIKMEDEKPPRFKDGFARLYLDTSNLMFSPDYKDLPLENRTSFGETILRTGLVVEELGIEKAQVKCASLAKTCLDPWGCNLNLNEAQNSVENFFTSEPGEIARARIERLILNGDEQTAFRLCNSYVTAKEPEFWRNNDMSSNLGDNILDKELFPVFVQLVKLLSKLSDLRAIVERTSCLSCHEGIRIIRVFLTENTEDSLRLSLILTEIFLLRDLINPNIFCCTKELMEIWSDLQLSLKVEQALVQDSAWKIIVYHASTSAHFYLFVDVLWQRYGNLFNNLYIEFFIRGLTSDLNHLEVTRVSSPMSIVHELETHIAAIYAKFSKLFQNELDIARECLLSAFALRPSPELLNDLNDMCIALNDLHGLSPSQQFDNCEVIRPGDDSRGIVAIVPANSEAVGLISGPVLYQEPSFKPPEISETLNKTRFNFDSILQKELAKNHNGLVNPNVSTDSVNTSDSSRTELNGETSRKCNCEGRCTTPDLQQRIPCRTYPFEHPILHSKSHSFPLGVLEDLTTIIENTRSVRWRNFTDWRYFPERAEDFLNDYIRNQQTRKAPNNDSDGDGSATEYEDEQQALPLLSSVKAEPYTPKVVVPAATAPPPPQQQPKKPIKVYSDSETETDEESDSFDTTSSSSEDITNSDQTWEEKRKKSIRKAKKNTRNNPNERNRLINQILRSTRKKKHRKVKGDKDRESRNKASKKKRRHKYNRIKEPPIETTQSDDNSSSEIIKVITSKKSQLQTQTQPRPQPRPRQKSIDVNNPAQVESIVGSNPRIMLSRLAMESQQKTPEKVAQKPKPVVVVATTTTTALVPSAIPSTSAGFTKQDVRTKLQVSLLAKQAHVNKGALQIPPQPKIVEKQTQQQLPPPPPPTVTIIKTEGVEHLDTIINSVAAGNTPIAITTTTVQKTAPGSVLLKKKSSKKLLGITALKNPASSATATVAPLSKTVRKILKDRQLKKKKKKKKNVCHIQTQTDYFPPDLSMVPRLASDYLAPPPPTVLVKYKPGQPEIELNLNSQTPPFLNKYFSDLDGSPSFTVGGIFTYCTLTPPSQSFPKSFKELSYTDSIDSLKVMSQFYKPPTKLKTGSRVAKSSSKSTLQSKGKKQLTNIIKTSSPKSGQKSKKSVKNASPAVSQNVALENTNATVQNPITSTQNVVAVQNTHITTQNAIDAVQNVTTTQNAVAATAQNPNVTAQKTKVVVPKSEVKTTTTIISNTSTTQSQVIAFKTIMINGKIVAVPISTAGGASTRLPVATKSVVHKLKTVNIRPQQQQCVVRPIVSNSVVLNQTLPVTGVPLYVVGQQQQQNTAGRNPPPQQGVVRVQQTVINPAPTKTKKVWTTQRKHGEMTYRKAENSGIQDIDHGLVACIREMKTKLHKKGVAPAQSNNIPPPTNTTTNSVLVSESNVSVSGLSAFDSSQQWASSSMEPTMVNAASQSTEPIPPPPPPAVAAPIQLKNILDQALDEAEVPKTIIDSKDLEELSFPIDYLQQLDDADCAQADPESRAETATLYAAPPTERDALCSPNEFDFLNDAASPTSGMSGSFSPNSGNEKAKKKRKKVESGEQPDLGSPQPPKKKKHHGPPVVCPLCNKTMASSYNLRRHLKQVHHIELNSPKIDKELEKYLNSLKTSSNDLKPAVDEAPYMEGLSARLLGPDQIKVEDGSGAMPSEDPLPPVPVPAPKPKTSRPKKPSAKKRKTDVVPGQETPSETVSTIVDKVIEGELGNKSTSKRAQQTGEKKPRKPRPPRTPKSKQTTPKSKETPPKAILPFGNSSTQFNVAEFNEMLCNDPVLKSLHDRIMGSENTNFVSDCVRNTMESIINQVVECSFKDNPPSTSSLECSANSEGAKPTITVPLVKTRELEKAMDPKSTSTVAHHRNETNLDVRSCQSIFEALKEARFKSLAMLNENSQDIAMNLGHTEPEKDDNSSRNVGSKDDWIMDVNQSLSMADNMDFDNLLDMDLNKVLDENDKDMGNILDPMKPEELMDQQELELSIKAMMESISTDGPRQQLDATNYNPVNQGVMAQLLEEDLDSVVTTRSQEVIAKDGLDFVNADHKCMRENLPETKGITEDLTPMLLEQINAPEVTATGTELVKTQPEGIEDSVMQDSKTLPGAIEASVAVFESTRGSLVVTDSEAPRLADSFAIANNNSKPFAEPIEAPRTILNSVEDSKAVLKPVEESKTVPEPVEESKTLPEPVEESKTVPEPVEESKTVPEPVEESKTVPEPVEESKTVPEPVEESKTVPEPVDESKTVPEPVEESKTVPEPVEESKTVPEPVEESKTVPEPVEESKTVPEPVEESKTVPEPVEESKTVPGPVEESKTVREPVEESKTVPEPVEESKTVPEHVEESKTVPEPFEESKTVPEPFEESKTVPEPAEESKTVPEPVEESKTVPEPIGDSKSVNETVEASTAVPEPVEETKTVPETVEVSKSVPEAVDSKTVPDPVEDSKSVNETVEDSKSGNETVEDSKSAPKTVDDSKTVPEPIVDSKTVPETVEDSKSAPKTVENSKTIPKTISDSAISSELTVPKNLEDSNIVPEPIDVSVKVPEPVTVSKTLLKDSKTASEPLKDLKTTTRNTLVVNMEPMQVEKSNKIPAKKPTRAGLRTVTKITKTTVSTTKAQPKPEVEQSKPSVTPTVKKNVEKQAPVPAVAKVTLPNVNANKTLTVNSATTATPSTQGVKDVPPVTPTVPPPPVKKITPREKQAKLKRPRDPVLDITRIVLTRMIDIIVDLESKNAAKASTPVPVATTSKTVTTSRPSTTPSPVAATNSKDTNAKTVPVSKPSSNEKASPVPKPTTTTVAKTIPPVPKPSTNSKPSTSPVLSTASGDSKSPTDTKPREVQQVRRYSAEDKVVAPTRDASSRNKSGPSTSQPVTGKRLTFQEQYELQIKNQMLKQQTEQDKIVADERKLQEMKESRRKVTRKPPNPSRLTPSKVRTLIPDPEDDNKAVNTLVQGMVDSISSTRRKPPTTKLQVHEISQSTSKKTQSPVDEVKIPLTVNIDEDITDQKTLPKKNTIRKKASEPVNNVRIRGNSDNDTSPEIEVIEVKQRTGRTKMSESIKRVHVKPHSPRSLTTFSVNPEPVKTEPVEPTVRPSSSDKSTKQSVKSCNIESSSTTSKKNIKFPDEIVISTRSKRQVVIKTQIKDEQEDKDDFPLVVLDDSPKKPSLATCEKTESVDSSEVDLVMEVDICEDDIVSDECKTPEEGEESVSECEYLGTTKNDSSEPETLPEIKFHTPIGARRRKREVKSCACCEPEKPLKKIKSSNSRSNSPVPIIKRTVQKPQNKITKRKTTKRNTAHSPTKISTRENREEGFRILRSRTRSMT